MRIIGVLDLAAGRAVHARAGGRERYTPVRQAGGTAIDGDAIALARVYVRQLDVDELYVADLDAIVNAGPPHEVVRSVASLHVPIWLDAGVSSALTAQGALAAGATRVIVGLETLSSFEALDDVCRAVGGDRVAFSLDLRDGEPITLAGAGAPRKGATGDAGHVSIEDIARRAADAGVSALTVIDLARVGMGGGPDLEAIARVRAAVGEIALIAGGGVRGPGDLARLAEAGCDGALVASALHDGRLTALDVAAVRDLHRSVSR
jgi:phosphoribosylformimino-5-aminoimidazole carboxamide ribotide isomerase